MRGERGRDGGREGDTHAFHGDGFLLIIGQLILILCGGLIEQHPVPRDPISYVERARRVRGLQSLELVQNSLPLGTSGPLSSLEWSDHSQCFLPLPHCWRVCSREKASSSSASPARRRGLERAACARGSDRKHRQHQRSLSLSPFALSFPLLGACALLDLLFPALPAKH